MEIRQRLAAIDILVSVCCSTTNPPRPSSPAPSKAPSPTRPAAIVPGATVTLTNRKQASFRTLRPPTPATTGSPPRQRPLHHPGRAAGFKTVIQEHIRLQVAETKTINLVMEVGATRRK